jgi:hypothetical protein
MQAQAAFAYGVQDPLPMPNDHMLHWLARAAKRLREHAGRKQVHIAAALDRDQSTIYRFEQNGMPDGPFFGWPGEGRRYIAAYADDLGIKDPQAIWLLALEMWREGRDLPDRVNELVPRENPDASAARRPGRGTSPRSFAAAAGSARTRPARRRRAAG